MLVASVLSPGSPLTALHLRNNWLGTDGMIKLAAAVRAHGGLRHLDVSNEGARPKDFSRVDTSQVGLLEMFKSLLVCVCGFLIVFIFPLQHVLIVGLSRLYASGEYPSSHLEMYLVGFHL